MEAQGTAQPSFTADLILANMNASPEEEYFNKCVTGILYATGSDTSVSALESFFLAMSLYPEIQRKAQAELDLIIGPGRIPTLSDRSQLPYIDALIQEVHRWNPVVPLGLPHKVSQDDTYDGYFIPANSTIIVNIWAILHDPTIYPDPMEFRPERYLVNKDDRESIGQVNPDPHLYAFGFGRRRCPGITLAEDLIFMAITATLTVFDIGKAIGPDGLPIEPQVEFHGTISIRMTNVNM
ncbi:cytochrome P450 [Wolfiporia cocos MD-104 SS10]|uniref:Cytochrome P450 n=1 Tax=Wolfiporia cocos (strain MD-104) TaxID=742152 RepID=A0A2H3JIJ8_WOLCO|nr:cytochrome P450 [Wolfiporia cocos MD-104 SS10]